MRLLILAAAATLAISGTAMAAQHHHHHHAADATAASTPVPEGAVPADVLSPHELVLRNLHDSGHNPANDFAPPN
jgi:hypothetical protein